MHIYARPLVLCEQNMGNKFIIAVIIRKSPPVSGNPINCCPLFVLENHMLLFPRSIRFGPQGNRSSIMHTNIGARYVSRSG